MIKSILVFLTLLAPTSIEVAIAPPPEPHLEVFRHVLKNRADLDLPYANRLSKAIYKASTAHGLNPIKVSAILRQECRYRLKCINAVTKDYGIGQINIKTIHAFKFDKTRLLNDLDYSVEAAVIVLADFKRMYGQKEQDYWTRYNTSNPEKRKKYKQLVAQYL